MSAVAFDPVHDPVPVPGGLAPGKRDYGIGIGIGIGNE
jgi:hypothetical protein